MIEMLGVLAIIGVLSAGGIMGYSAAMENYRVNSFIEDAKTMAVAYQSLFKKAKNSNTPTITTAAQLYHLGILPSKYYIGENENNYIKSPFPDARLKANVVNDYKIDVPIIINGKNITILKPSTFFQFAIVGLSKSACVKLMRHDWNTISPIGGVTGIHYPGYKVLFKNKYSLTDADIICNDLIKNNGIFLIDIWLSGKTITP